MTPTSIAGASFLADPALGQVLAAIEASGGVARVVGGAVRNFILGLEIDDVDIATTLRPEATIAAVAMAGLRAIPTGIEHGTVTVIADGKGFEVTTLRADVETDGRRAVVAFTEDFAADAGRRDFTMNAVYADRAGNLFDPTGGIVDIAARCVRFIGSPEQRIREDYLRILRFFRFHARFGSGAPEPAGLAACVRLRAGIDRLSRERVGQEMQKLVMATRAADTLHIMAETGILAEVLRQPAYPDRFNRLPSDAGIALRLAVLAVDQGRDIAALAECFRLSNSVSERIQALVLTAESLGSEPGEDAVRLAVYRQGNDIAADGLLFNACKTGIPASCLPLARTWSAPAFPVSGKDLIAKGVPPGPELGRQLKELEAAWIARGYRD